MSIECKNQEKVNVWESYKQAEDNSKDYEPVVVIKRNNSKPLVLVDAEYFVSMFKKL
jgi:PHD/YefM family antitoxin component YafN of YafNO toxin-antitoxin module